MVELLESLVNILSAIPAAIELLVNVAAFLWHLPGRVGRGLVRLARWLASQLGIAQTRAHVLVNIVLGGVALELLLLAGRWTGLYTARPLAIATVLTLAGAAAYLAWSLSPTGPRQARR